MTIEEIEKLCQDPGLSPGPWEDDIEEEKSGEIRTSDGYSVCSIHFHANINTIARTGQVFSHADAKFIAASRTIIPELLKEIKRLQNGEP